ncbi:hypothetical protein [Tumebacillus flagellatus]|uniref:Uncharacterized protein n=1 Tax=Tumebacillus flagellatus TaxID=1157490 RepID=A0A074LWB1_9BACL|nr:hypothetical protein [Tumebacillus flagellatus]KEO85139.1 hypothetical protein EL26_00850 [Tumebacillus flagellatus]
MMDKKKICILIIHGMGEQGVYETLDVFTRNLVESLQTSPDSHIQLTHHRMRLQGDMHDYIKLSRQEDSSMELDIHEYYWAHTMQRVISFQEVVQWLIRASDGAEKFYEENEELARRYEHDDAYADAYRNGKFKRRWYLKHIGIAVRLFYGLSRLFGSLLPKTLEPLFRLLMGKPEQMIVDYVGDVAIYTSSDRKSKFYETRRTVLEGAAEKLTALLRQDYDKVVIVGHALGSVIAYDAMNLLNLRANHDEQLAQDVRKLFELVTIGSPLDKVKFFFREHVPKGEYVKRLILNSLNGFRRRDVQTAEDEHTPELSSTLQNHLQHLHWTNYYDLKDPIGGHLDFYEGVENIQVHNGQEWGFAHLGYWQNPCIYQDVIQRVELAGAAAHNDMGVGETA